MADPHPDEPVFTIRAQDMLAPNAVEAWAAFAEIAGQATGVIRLHEMALDARRIAGKMREWQAENPHLTKWPD